MTCLSWRRAPPAARLPLQRARHPRCRSARRMPAVSRPRWPGARRGTSASQPRTNWSSGIRPRDIEVLQPQMQLLLRIPELGSRDRMSLEELSKMFEYLASHYRIYEDPPDLPSRSRPRTSTTRCAPAAYPRSWSGAIETPTSRSTWSPDRSPSCSPPGSTSSPAATSCRSTTRRPWPLRWSSFSPR